MESLSEDHTISCRLLGAIPKHFGNRFIQTGITAGTAQAQKIVLLGSAKILRKVLEI